MSDFELERSPEARASWHGVAGFQISARWAPMTSTWLCSAGSCPSCSQAATEVKRLPISARPTSTSTSRSSRMRKAMSGSSKLRALNAIGAEPDGGSRRLAMADSLRRKPRGEFLCDLEDQPEGVTVSCPAAGGSEQRTSAVLASSRATGPKKPSRGSSTAGSSSPTRPALPDWRGYLLAKSYAARHRGAEKGSRPRPRSRLQPRGRTRKQGCQLGGGQFADDVNAARNHFPQDRGEIQQPSDYAAQSYARQALRVDPEARPRTTRPRRCRRDRRIHRRSINLV